MRSQGKQVWEPWASVRGLTLHKNAKPADLKDFYFLSTGSPLPFRGQFHHPFHSFTAAGESRSEVRGLHLISDMIESDLLEKGAQLSAHVLMQEDSVQAPSPLLQGKSYLRGKADLQGFLPHPCLLYCSVSIQETYKSKKCIQEIYKF